MSSQPSPTKVGWAEGLTVFAASLLMLVGIFQALQGLAAIINDQRFVVTGNYIYKFDTTQWGWIHLILGAILILSGLGIMSGNVVARTVGVFVAALSAIANFAFIPYQPVWSIIIVTVDVLVIWALTVHGRELATP